MIILLCSNDILDRSCVQCRTHVIVCHHVRGNIKLLSIA